MVTEILDAPPLPRFLGREFPFTRRALRLPTGQKLCFVDEGRGRPVLMVHGNPTWSYLYRNIIRRLCDRGFRCVAPDLLGFGFSEKPLSPSAHRLDLHVESVRTLANALGLDDMIIVGQDWGGPIVCAAASRLPLSRTSGVVLGNTAVLRPARPFRSKGFHKFSHFPMLSDVVFRGLAFPIPVLWQVQGDRRSIGPKELRAYYHPFRMPWNRAGPLGLARMVPNREDHPSTAVMDALADWWPRYEAPMALVWGKKDPLLGRTLERHRKAFPQAEVVETEAGHFLQEEVPDQLADAIIRVSR